mmetsp:Transcript_30837/g.49470  ORF Transcript_30837/g.49470 Transcript_30837/m.49470 type:complete len:370 (+) Transcript_30837:374-1483(+)
MVTIAFVVVVVEISVGFAAHLLLRSHNDGVVIMHDHFADINAKPRLQQIGNNRHIHNAIIIIDNFLKFKLSVMIILRCIQSLGDRQYMPRIVLFAHNAAEQQHSKREGQKQGIKEQHRDLKRIDVRIPEHDVIFAIQIQHNQCREQDVDESRHKIKRQQHERHHRRHNEADAVLDFMRRLVELVSVFPPQFAVIVHPEIAHKLREITIVSVVTKVAPTQIVVDSGQLARRRVDAVDERQQFVVFAVAMPLRFERGYLRRGLQQNLVDGKHSDHSQGIAWDACLGCVTLDSLRRFDPFRQSQVETTCIFGRAGQSMVETDFDEDESEPNQAENLQAHDSEAEHHDPDELDEQSDGHAVDNDVQPRVVVVH